MISKLYTIIQLDVVSPPQHLKAVNLLVSHSQDVYKSLNTSVLNDNIQFFRLIIDKSEILKESERGYSVT